MFNGKNRLYEFEGFCLDVSERLLTKKGKRTQLPEKAFEVLSVLLRNSGHLVSKDDLLSEVWSGTFVEENNLDKNISILRRALGERRGGAKYIETVRGRGYRFVAEVRSKDSPGNVAVPIVSPVNGPDDTIYLPTNEYLIPHSATTGTLTDRGPAQENAGEPLGVIPHDVRLNRATPGTQRPRRVILLVFAVAFVILLGIFAFNGFRKTPVSLGAPIRSIAVLPFANGTGNSDMDYLSDGLSDDLIDRLSQLPELKVIARSSSYKYRGTNIDLRDAAEKLGVQAIVTGSVSRRDDDLLIRVEMIDSREDRQLWGEQYHGAATDALSLQKGIALAASEKLRLKLSDSDSRNLTNKITTVPAAYELYQRGHFLQHKPTPPDLFRSVEYFRQAVALDPDFAPAYVGLAESTGKLSAFRGIPKQNYKQMAREYAAKALSLDDQLPEAHATLGSFLAMNDYDFAGAEREYQRALELNPNYAEAHLWRGQLLSSLGRHEEALDEIRRGMDLDPMSTEARSNYGEALFYARRYDESIAHLKKVLNMDPNYFAAHRILSFSYEMKGDYAARIAEAVKMNEIGGTRERAKAVQKSFDNGGWKGFLRDACADDSPFDLHDYLVATFCAELDNKDEALAILNRLFEDRSSSLVLIKVDPRLDNLRGDPRFQDLLKHVGFAE